MPITSGFASGMDVPTTLRLLWDELPTVGTVVCRSLDSQHSAPEIVRVMERFGVSAQLVSGNACLHMDALTRALAARVFSGFDELWILSNGPPRVALDGLPAATTDAADFEVETPLELDAATREHGCVLILGDGDGLNWATTSPAIARRMTDEE